MRPWQKKCWCIPVAGPEFVWHMEDVLDLYQRPYDQACPLICLDETLSALIEDVSRPQPAKPGRPQRYDYEYFRRGTVNLWMLFEPLAGWREVRLSSQRRRTEWAEVVAYLLEQRYPQAQKLVLVMDNLNTHTPASLYELFAPAKAKALADRLEIHYTPKHGSWLNMAEIELSVLDRQCLRKRIGTLEQMGQQTQAWSQARNARGASVDWRFTTDDARIRLRKLYPSIDG